MIDDNEHNKDGTDINGEFFDIEETDVHPIAQMFGIRDTQLSDIKPSFNDMVPVKPDQYDEKDLELDREFSELSKVARKSFEEQKTLAMTVEPKYRAELLNAANTLLNTALSSIKEKRELKKHKDKLTKPVVNVNHANIMIGNRNEVLRERKKQLKDVDPD